MVDLIFSYIVKALLIIVCCCLYIFLISKIFPAIFFQARKNNTSPKGRGIKKYVFDSGRAIVYYPDPNTKKYITQYILSENNGERFLKCKFDDRVVTASYEVTAFDSSDKIIDTVSVYDTPDCREISRAVPLPITTAYVNISVTEINRQKITEAKKEPALPAPYLLFIALNFAVTAMISLIINAAAIHIAELCLRTSKEELGIGNAFPIIFAFIVSLIYSANTIKKNRNKN